MSFFPSSDSIEFMEDYSSPEEKEEIKHVSKCVNITCLIIFVGSFVYVSCRNFFFDKIYNY